ncbi:FAD-dependent hydroxylase [[Phormidium] sp. ETS-05]|uniref:FAD-dependent hydroxylase n=1 Tax=[Phormidium] sp. ETS-05 TaxID=222819 RepID=UPI0018EF0704|nr:FAD-dependent hydroxylase [[Phormidium] sp. ETS-05]
MLQSVSRPSSEVNRALPAEVNMTCDVAIVGGGVAGATLAAALKNTGMKVALVELQPQAVAAAKTQVYAISLLSAQIFADIGVWEQIRPHITPFKKIRLSDADYPGVVEFYPEDLGRTEELGYVAEHGALIKPLQDFLNASGNITWFCPAEVVKVEYESDGVILQVRDAANGDGEAVYHRIRSQLLVAADGSKSPIRSAAGIPTDGWKYWQSCITTKIKPEKPHNNIAYEKFWPSGPFAILPLTGNRCNVVWTAPHAEAQALAVLDDAAFLQELKRRYGDQMGELELLGPRFVWSVQLMQSRHYVKDRLALVGDAAHCCHPVGGQGLNLGIRDAAALAQVLKNAYRKNADMGSKQVLQEYERWRQWENLTILGFTDFLDRMFSHNFWPLVAVRRLGLWGLRSIFPLKQFALRLMTGQTGRRPVG